VFCREQQSFDFVTRQASRANVFLSNDLAFNCNFDETRRQMHTCFVPDLFDRVLLIRDSKRLARAAIHTLKSHGRTDVLNVFRGDVEKTAAEIPDINIDLPKAFAADDTSPAASLHATYWMMKFMERFKLIRTNRLHTGIMATLLGKETELYDNAYGKVHDVFSYSIRGKFPKVKWMG
jgi:exopolysaccharide biosynthesis predicted pyruvyltransferase EpsI